MRAVNEHSGRSEPELPTLFLEFHGAPAAVEEEIETVRAIAAEHGGGEFAWAATTQERAAMWRARHQAYFAGRGLRPGARRPTRPTSACRSRRSPRCIALAERLASELPFPGRWSATSPTATSTASCSCATTTRASGRSRKEFVDALVTRAHALGGTCTGEHGIGIGKREALVAEVGEEGVEVMRALKRALDPLNLLNPGKVLLDAPAPVLVRPRVSAAASDRPPAAQRANAEARLDSSSYCFTTLLHHDLLQRS